ncbi:BREX-1 system phosphatase PglZ type A [Enterocloster lavalensis]|uniref:BREX-1 system phosphatase PglZ type A n=1 Tax=Enterocloster lavalensis TaxID=460384 RepID=UPI001D071074|nr:BREX-1 system phosphatase PglZ type A [Enterocloster lavalensis]MCB6346662.1 BREX-1 system phosphatase PglZ type A [Enterocloster lavalensis]
MEELNLQEIEKKLNQEFASGQRIIFWYDANAAFEDSVGRLKLDGVILHRLTEQNAFRTKLLLEHDDTERRFLVYAPFAKPGVEENHLEDTLRYSREFYADKLSLIAAELHLPDRLRPALQKMEKFFGIGLKKTSGAGVRTNQFIERAKEAELSSSGEETVYILAMCVLSEARNSTFDSLVCAVLNYGDVGEQKVLSKFAEFDLEKTFWELCQSKFGYADPKPSLQKFTMSLFATYICRDFRDTAPKAWQSFLLEKASNVNVLLDNMMNSVIDQNTFDRLSEQMSSALEVPEVFEKIPLEDVLECAAVAETDQRIIQWMISRELDENKLAAVSGKKIPDICELRERLHFGTRFQWEYKALRAAYRMLSVISYEPKKSLTELIDSYCREDYEIDTAYRNFLYAYDQMEDTIPFEKLKEQVENLYLTEYLEKIVYAWNAAIEKNAMHRVIMPQSSFYQEKVARVKEKVAVIISDAFRYEVAGELFERLMRDQNCSAEMEAMMGTLPSYTALGMAELLPHATVSMTADYTVLVDGKPCASTEQREKLLRQESENSSAVDFEAVRSLSASELKQFSAKKSVIYIYHNKIDAVGEAQKTEHTVFRACEEAVEDIYALIKRLSKSGNIYRFYVTADHGFLYTRRRITASDKLEHQSSKGAFLDRRFVIDERRLAADGVYALPLGDCLLNGDDRFVMLPKGMSVFKAGGGMNYVHGGSSPQELLLPCIFVRTQKGLVATEDAKLLLVTNLSKITNLLTTVDFLQEEPVSDVIKETDYRIRFQTEDGEVISNEILYTADSRSEDPRERMFRLKFDIKRKSYEDNKKYFLKIFHEKKGTECLSRQILMDLPYTDDFGF